MKAILLYQCGNNITQKVFEGQSIMFLTNGQPDFRVYVNDEFVFSVSPNHFISFEYL